MPAEALQSAEKADHPMADLGRMRIRYERDINARKVVSRFAPTRHYQAVFNQPNPMKPGSLQTGEAGFPFDWRSHFKPYLPENWCFWGVPQGGLGGSRELALP